ncbi:MAG: hypothetical protein Q8L68_07490 [Methylococcales bacterium]|nr:hypothetical protein [Methylococcales bacterium]
MKNQTMSVKNQFEILPIFAIALKFFSVISIVLGFVFEGLIIYVWGRITAFYDILRSALNAFTRTFSALGGDGATAPPQELLPIPAWPLLIILLIVLLGIIITALSLWAGGEWVNMKLALADEERESRAMQEKAISIMTHNIASIANYFSTLAPPRPKL